jgi:hypothetical protein
MDLYLSLWNESSIFHLDLFGIFDFVLCFNERRKQHHMGAVVTRKQQSSRKAKGKNSKKVLYTDHRVVARCSPLENLNEYATYECFPARVAVLEHRHELKSVCVFKQEERGQAYLDRSLQKQNTDARRKNHANRMKHAQ